MRVKQTKPIKVQKIKLKEKALNFAALNSTLKNGKPGKRKTK